MSNTIALVDCNNFYVSCERLFRPDLNGKPVVVLSNNDGCIVSRSAEAKALGVGMAIPAFKARDLMQQHRITQFSSNYALYGDISARVMDVLDTLSPAVEVYSIDEAFVDLSQAQTGQQRLEQGQRIRQRIQQWVGVPVCVGIGPTKTLAKLANQLAKDRLKQQPDGNHPGVLDLSSPAGRDALLATVPIRTIWGIGPRLMTRLTAIGIQTAHDLAHADARLMRRRFSVHVERTILELRGTPCISLDDAPAPNKQIICSRSFSKRVTNYQHLKEAVCEYAARAAEKLRHQHQYARLVTVSIRTSPYSQSSQREGFNYRSPYRNSRTQPLDTPSADSRNIIAAAMAALDQIYRDNLPYAKAGVMLTDLCDSPDRQFDLLRPESNPAVAARSSQLMHTLDQINNSKLGKVMFAGQGLKQPWYMNRNYMSPRYTTAWEDLPQVK